MLSEDETTRNSLAVQWLGICAFTAEGLGSIPCWGTRIPQAARCGPPKKKTKNKMQQYNVGSTRMSGGTQNSIKKSERGETRFSKFSLSTVHKAHVKRLLRLSGPQRNLTGGGRVAVLGLWWETSVLLPSPCCLVLSVPQGAPRGISTRKNCPSLKASLFFNLWAP